jgi:hypothetical protein
MCKIKIKKEDCSICLPCWKTLRHCDTCGFSISNKGVCYYKNHTSWIIFQLKWTRITTVKWHHVRCWNMNLLPYEPNSIS